MNELARSIYKANKSKGFWSDDPKERNVAECIALMHSELSEALEAHRSGETWPTPEDLEITKECLSKNEDIFKLHFESRVKNSLPDELADTIIRVLDFCGAHGIDIETHIDLKLRYNQTRAHKHGKKL